jgi:hypothetical protein
MKIQMNMNRKKSQSVVHSSSANPTSAITIDRTPIASEVN